MSKIFLAPSALDFSLITHSNSKYPGISSKIPWKRPGKALEYGFIKTVVTLGWLPDFSRIFKIKAVPMEEVERIVSGGFLCNISNLLIPRLDVLPQSQNFPNFIGLKMGWIPHFSRIFKTKAVPMEEVERIVSRGNFVI